MGIFDEQPWGVSASGVTARREEPNRSPVTLQGMVDPPPRMYDQRGVETVEAHLEAHKGDALAVSGDLRQRDVIVGASAVVSPSSVRNTQSERPSGAIDLHVARRAREMSGPSLLAEDSFEDHFRTPQETECVTTRDSFEQGDHLVKVVWVVAAQTVSQVVSHNS